MYLPLDYTTDVWQNQNQNPILKNFFSHDTHTLAGRLGKETGEKLEQVRFVKIKSSLQISSIN